MKGLVGLLIIVLLLALVGCSQDNNDSAGTDGEAVVQAATATIVEQVSEAVETIVETGEPPTLSPPLVSVQTNTPIPATNTPAATDTPVPTLMCPPLARRCPSHQRTRRHHHHRRRVPVPPTEPPPPPPPPCNPRQWVGRFIIRGRESFSWKKSVRVV